MWLRHLRQEAKHTGCRELSGYAVLRLFWRLGSGNMWKHGQAEVPGHEEADELSEEPASKVKSKGKAAEKENSLNVVNGGAGVALGFWDVLGFQKSDQVGKQAQKVRQSEPREL